MKRQSLLLFGWLLLATPAAVQAQFNYTVTNQTVTITGYTGNNGVVAIPSTINGLPVTSIGDYTFQYSSITGVTIPNSVTNIGDYAFNNCYSLTNVTLGSGVTSIGDFAFAACSSLTSATIPNSVTNIGDAAFAGASLTNIMVDPLNSAFSSVDGVLFNQSQTTLVEYPGGKLGGYTIPNSVTSIGDYAFFSCASLTNVTIPNSVTNIGNWAFSGCSSLTNITLGSGVTSIGDYGFSGFVGEAHRLGCPLINVTIPNSVTNIGNWAFAACLSLANITLGSGVTSIGDGAFVRCSSLTNVTIPNSVTSIGDVAFSGCSSLTNITLGSGVTSIGVSAFSGFVGDPLINVTIPNSVTNIGADAFYSCSSLTRVYFQGNAPNVGGTNLFSADPVTIYYLPGTVGWGSTFGGAPTALWTLPYPLILTSNPSFGVRTNQFGFTVSWATNLNVVVEAATDLANPIWSPVQTNTLSGGSFHFTDPYWTNYPTRFYRVRSQ